MNFRRCHLQYDKLKIQIFVNKNWPNDYKVDYKTPFNLVKLIEMDMEFEEQLKNFERSFEKDEIVNM